MIDVKPWARNQRNNAHEPDYPADSQCRPTVTAGEYLAILAHRRGAHVAEELKGTAETLVLQAIQAVRKLPEAEWCKLWGLPPDAPGLRAGRSSMVRETWESGQPRSVNANFAALRWLLKRQGIELADISPKDVEVYADGTPRVMEPMGGSVKDWHALRERAAGGLVDAIYSWRKTNGSIFSHFVNVCEIKDGSLVIADPYGLCDPSGHPDRRFKLNAKDDELPAFYELTFLEAKALGLTSRVHHIKLA